MVNFNEKNFLDYAGLAQYDELIKSFISEKAGASSVDLSTESARAQAAEQALIDSLANLANGAVAENTAAIAKLNGEGEGSVKKAVEDAVASIVDGAPEALDTLKEIAEWIASDETGTAALLNKVSELEEADEEIKAYIDAQDTALYNAIQSVEEIKIAALFPIVQGNEDAAFAIAALNEGKAIKLSADQTITDNITIDKACYIDANGSTFEGTIKVPADKEVVIVNAIFANPVVVE